MSRRPLVLVSITAILAFLLGLTTLSTASPPTPSPVQVVGQLEIEGLQGEGTHQGFEGAIEIRSFDFLATNTATEPPRFPRMDVVIPMESASVGLLERLALGNAIPTVKISLTRSAEGRLQAYKVFTLSDATVSAVNEYASGQDDDIPLVQVSFLYRTIGVEQDTGGPPVTFCWVVRSQSAC